MIFISHKKEDGKKAEDLARYLTSVGVDNFVDVLDTDQKKVSITDHIVYKLRKSTHLIVIFSEKTNESMWVPFELGVAFERDCGIGVLLWGNSSSSIVQPPEYLDSFPVMKTKDDINEYIKLYKSMKKKVLANESSTRSFSKTASDISESYASKFIRELKGRIA